MQHESGRSATGWGLTALSAAVGILTLWVRAPALAQEPEEAAAPGAKTIEEIVVTARRRNEDIQTVPIAISHFSADDLRGHDVETVADLQRYVPSLVSLNVTNRDANQLSIRGLPGVVAYFAEAPVVSALSAAFSGTGSGSGPGLYYDLQSLEVLKGPQSTLFGGTTTGGAVLFNPKKPTNNYEGYAQVTLGDYNDRELEGAVNLPIVPDKLMVRFAGQTQQRDGFTYDVINHKDLDNRDYFAGRIGVLLQPTDGFDNYFVYSSFYNHGNGAGEKLSAVNPDGFALAAFGDALLQALAQQQALGPRQTALDASEITKEYTFRFVDIAQGYVSDSITLRNIAAYTESKYLFRWDLDGSPLPIVAATSPSDWTNNLASYSEELQIQGKSLGDNLIWTAGTFLQFTHPAGYSYVQAIEFDIPQNTVIRNPLTTASWSTTKEQALYAQGTYDMGDVTAFLSNLKLTTGYRYSWDYASNVQEAFNGIGVCQSVANATVPNCSNGIGGHFKQGTWTLALDYQLAPDTLVYVTGRRGYNPGGVNIYAVTGVPKLPGQSTTNVPREYQPEHLTDIELGAKSGWTLWGMEGRTNVDLYHDHYTNIQRNVAVLGAGLSTITENAAEATLEGIEFEGTLKPISSVELTGIYAYSNSRYDKYLSPSAGNLNGLPFTGGPRNQYSATGRYHLPIGASLGDASISATYSWQSHIQFSDREVGGIVPAHGLLDVRVDWNDIAGRPVDASFYMSNATDQVYMEGGTIVYNALGLNSILLGEPRMWGFQLRYRFGPQS
jgi:iron complex outermembrane receptor protein